MSRVAGATRLPRHRPGRIGAVRGRAAHACPEQGRVPAHSRQTEARALSPPTCSMSPLSSPETAGTTSHARSRAAVAAQHRHPRRAWNPPGSDQRRCRAWRSRNPPARPATQTPIRQPFEKEVSGVFHATDSTGGPSCVGRHAAPAAPATPAAPAWQSSPSSSPLPSSPRRSARLVAEIGRIVARCRPHRHADRRLSSGSGGSSSGSQSGCAGRYQPPAGPAAGCAHTRCAHGQIRAGQRAILPRMRRQRPRSSGSSAPAAYWSGPARNASPPS